MNIAVVVPIYRLKVTQDERVSLNHLVRFLSGYPLFAASPQGIDAPLSGAHVMEFPAKHFASVSAYSKLLLSRTFYQAFAEYDYILIYQTDCLVFSPDLRRFCEMGFDLIGAPLFEKNRKPLRVSRVGNGGLSLRRVQAFLDVLNSAHVPAWPEIFTIRLGDLYKFSGAFRWIKKIKIIRDARRGVKWYTHYYSLNEDLFWSDRANLFNPNFKIAPLDVALQFAFDAHPRYCFEQNNRELPFGAHAWAKWDRDFWEPHLLS